MTHVLMIPMLLNSLNYLRKSKDLNSQFLDSEVLKKFVFLLHFLFISCHILASHLFSYDSDYLTKEPRARPCCSVTFKEEFLVILTCILSQTLTQGYFLILFAVISAACFKDYLMLSPYYKESENFLTAGMWMTELILSLFSLLENFLGLSNQSLLCFVFITPPAYFLLNYYMARAKTSVLSKRIENPHVLELKLRHFLLNKRDIDDDDIENIEKLFEDGTKMFLEFKMLSVWECNFVMQVKENSSLAMIKLSKMLYSKKRPKLFEKPERLFFYPFSLECEFVLYSLFKKLKKQDSAKDMMLIKYLKDLKSFKALDELSCQNLIELIDFQLLGTSVDSKEVDKKYLKFLKCINEKDRFFEKASKKYGNDHNFSDMNRSFKENLVWKFDGGSSVNSGITREFFLERLTGNKNIMNVATLILSGNPEDFGQVLYANEILLTLLKYPDENSIISVNYRDLFHEVFKDQLEFFLENLLLKNQIVFSIDQLFFLDFYGYTVEVALEVRITCLRGSFHFIVYVHQLNSSLNYVLLDDFGRVLTCSEKLKNIFTGYQKTINEVLPGFMEILRKEPEDQQFTYIGPTGNFLFQYNSMMTGKERILVIYTSEQDSSLNFYTNPSTKTPLGRRKSLTFSGKMMEDVFDFRKSMPASKRKNRFSDLYKRQGGKFVDLGGTIEKLIKINKYGNFLAFCALVTVYLGIIIFHLKFVDDSRFAETVLNVCSIRNTMITTLISARSIDLLQQGFDCGSNFTTYVRKIEKNVNETEKWLRNISIYETEFLTKSLFEDPQLTVFSFYNGISFSKLQNLYDSIYDFNEIMNQLLANNFSNSDSFLYIYKNGFYTLQQLLNQTAFQVFKKISEKAGEALIPLQLMNLFTLFPFCIILICSVLCFPKLQKINSGLTERVNLIPNKTLVLMRTRISDRIKKMHDSKFQKDFEDLENIRKNTWIWKKFIILVIFLVLAVLGFCFIQEYLIIQGYSQIIQNRLNYRFFGGLRTSVNQSFLWAREDALRAVKKGYLDIFQEFTEIESEESMATISLEKLRYLNSNGLLNSMKLNQKFNFKRFITVLIGDLCDASSFSGCENSFMKNGIYSASEILTEEMKDFVRSSQFQVARLAELEKMVAFYVLNSGILFEEFDKCANDIEFYRSLAVGIMSGIIFLVSFYYFCFICKELEFIRSILLSMNMFLRFHESDKK